MKRFPLLSLTVLVLAFACSKQGEGERCNLVNGNGDCEDGLQCVGTKGGNDCDTAESRFDCLPKICCPPPPQRSAVEQCNQYQYGEVRGTGGSGAGGNSGVGEETGGSGTAGDTGIGGTSSTSTEPTDAGA
jgi:hypothetical protein